jgi:hypothetical protein
LKDLKRSCRKKVWTTKKARCAQESDTREGAIKNYNSIVQDYEQKFPNRRRYRSASGQSVYHHGNKVAPQGKPTKDGAVILIQFGRYPPSPPCELRRGWLFSKSDRERFVAFIFHSFVCFLLIRQTQPQHLLAQRRKLRRQRQPSRSRRDRSGDRRRFTSSSHPVRRNRR